MKNIKNIIRETLNLGERQFLYQYYKREKVLYLRIENKEYEHPFPLHSDKIEIEGESLEQIVRDMKLELLGIS